MLSACSQVRGSFSQRMRAPLTMDRSNRRGSRALLSAAETGIDDRFHGEGEQHERDRGKDDQDAGRDYPPPVADVECAGPETLFQHLTPSGNGWIAETDKAQ